MGKIKYFDSYLSDNNNNNNNNNSEDRTFIKLGERGELHSAPKKWGKIYFSLSFEVKMECYLASSVCSMPWQHSDIFHTVVIFVQLELYN
jgi:hypothetical protein